MKPTKKLSLKRELLTELTSDQLASVVGAANAGGATDTCGCTATQTATNTCACVSDGGSCNVSICYIDLAQICS